MAQKPSEKFVETEPETFMPLNGAKPALGPKQPAKPNPFVKLPRANKAKGR